MGVGVSLWLGCRVVSEVKAKTLASHQLSGCAECSPSVFSWRPCVKLGKTSSDLSIPTTQVVVLLPECLFVGPFWLSAEPPASYNGEIMALGLLDREVLRLN